MPPNLTTQLALSVNAKLVTRCAFFDEVSDTALVSLVSRLEPLVFVPGQVVCCEGQPLTHLYFINRGKVTLLSHMGGEDETIVATLGEHDSIGLEDYLGTTSLSSRTSNSFTKRRGGSAGGGGGGGGSSSRGRVSPPPRDPKSSRRGEVSYSARSLSYCDVMQVSASRVPAPRLPRLAVSSPPSNRHLTFPHVCS